MLTLNFVVAGIFSGEFSYKADSVFYASCHGRGKAVAAKLGAGLLFITFVYFAMTLLYSGIVLAVFGTDGAGLLIQASPMGWKSFYLITNWQKYLLIVFGGYIGTLFILLLTMLVSARTNQTASLFALYQIGGKVVGSLHVLPVLYGGLALLLIPIVYQVYRRLSAG